MQDSEAIRRNHAALVSAGEAALLYNFRTRAMQSFASAVNPLEVSAFLPADELYLGLFEDYRSKGMSDLEALKRACQFGMQAR